MKYINITKKAIFLVFIMLISVTLPGCLDGINEPVDELDDSAPKEAMGLWWPTVDGIIEAPTISPITEWFDAHKIDIEFTDGNNDTHPAKLTYKVVDDNGFALAVEIDEGLKTSPNQIDIIFDDRTISTEVDLTATMFKPKIELNCIIGQISCEDTEESLLYDPNTPINEEFFDPFFSKQSSIASTYNLDTNTLVVEATASQVFLDSFDLTYEIMIDFGDSQWRYEMSQAFDWVLPLFVPQSDIRVTGIEVTQATQTADMGASLVNGKESLARVYIESGWLTTANVDVTLKYCILIFCVEELKKPNFTAVKNPERENFTHSANFVLPEHWVTHDIEEPVPIGLFASIEPNYTSGFIDYVDPDKSNNGLAEVFWFTKTHDLNIYYVPLTRGGAIASQTNIDTAIENVNLVLPTNPNWIGLPPDVVGATDGMSGDEIVIAGIELLPAMALLSVLTGGEFAFPDQITMLGDFVIPISGGSLLGTSTPGWHSDWADLLHSFATFACVSGHSQCIFENVIVHEMNHNLGPWVNDVEGWGTHIGGCNSNLDDDVWRANYGTDLTIQDIGWAYSVSNPETNPAALISSDYPDLASYCNINDLGGVALAGAPTGNWISPYRWQNMFDAFLNWEVGNPSGKQNQQSLTSRFTVVTVNDDGTGSIDYSYLTQGSMEESVGHDHDHSPHGHDGHENGSMPEFKVVATDYNGNVIKEIELHPEFVEPELPMYEHDYGPTQKLIVSVPDNGNVEAIELMLKNAKGGWTTIDMISSSDSTPTTRMQPLNQDVGSRLNEFSLSWTNAQSASNRNVVYQLEYNWGNDIWLPIGVPTKNTSINMTMSSLPAGDNSKFRVRAMNGLSTYYSESTSFLVENQYPELNLITSGALGINKITDSTRDNTQDRVIVEMGKSFSITPEIIDNDFTNINRDSCSAALYKDGVLIWIGGNDSNYRNFEPLNRIITWGDSRSGSVGKDSNANQLDNCKMDGNNLIPYSFPNENILPGEMTPGNYLFEMSYMDINNAKVSTSIPFTVAHEQNSKQRILEDYRKNLIQPEYDDSKQNLDMSRNELHYYAEVQRSSNGEENSLNEIELKNLVNVYNIGADRVTFLEELAR